jgi:hypothetical protein
VVYSNDTGLLLAALPAIGDDGTTYLGLNNGLYALRKVNGSIDYQLTLIRSYEATPENSPTATLAILRPSTGLEILYFATVGNADGFTISNIIALDTQAFSEVWSWGGPIGWL